MMSNVNQLTFNSIYQQLNMTAEQLYNKMYEISNTRNEYCPYFKPTEKGLIMFFYTTCIILQQPNLVRSSNSVPSVIPEIEKQTEDLIMLFGTLHNYFVYRKKENTIQARRFLFQTIKKANDYIINIAILCDQLICTSDLINKDFIYIASCIHNIQFFARHIITRFNENIIFYKNLLVLSHYPPYTHHNPSNITTSIKGNLPINIDLNTLRTNIAIHNYIELLICHYNQTNEVYKKFLFEELEKQYHCSFYKLLLCIANAELKNSSEQPLTKGTEVFLCDGQPIIFNQLSIVAGCEINQKDSCVAGPRSIVTQQSCNQTTLYSSPTR